MYLLDTNVWIRFLNGFSSAVVGRLQTRRPAEIRLCSVVKAELYAGARKSARVEENLLVLQDLFAPYVSQPFDDAAALHFGAICSDLERAGTTIGAYDLMIAAIARANDLVVVTHNVREFARVPGLRFEDWEG